MNTWLLGVLLLMLHSCAWDNIKDLESFPCVAFTSGVSQHEDLVYVKQAIMRLENLNELIRDSGKHYAGPNQLECWEEAGRHQFEKIGSQKIRIWGRGELSTMKCSADQSNISSRKVQKDHKGQWCRINQDPNHHQVKNTLRNATVQLAKKLRTVLWIWRWTSTWAMKVCKKKKRRVQSNLL